MGRVALRLKRLRVKRNMRIKPRDNRYHFAEFSPAPSAPFTRRKPASITSLA